MMLMPGRLSRLFGRTFAGNLLAAFGAVSAAIQFVSALFPAALSPPGLIMAGSMVFCLGWAVTRAYPRRRVRGEFPHPGMTIVIEKGDLFDVRGNIVVGFTDTFDTAVDCPVHAASVQGQLLNRLYGADPAKLDRELAFALRDTPPQSWERRANKPVGNLARYPLGTVAVLRQGSRRVFAVAYSRLGNNGVAQSGVEELWFSLNRLWDAVHRHGPQETITLPLVGTG
ncbi:macro domain-containing protein, partial [Kibdelosporangium lantanae]